MKYDEKAEVYWVAGLVLIGTILFGLSLLFAGKSTPPSVPAYSLSLGFTGMMGSSTGYEYGYMSNNDVTTEEINAVFQRYLDRQNQPDLILARLREFQWAYLAEVVERSTGRHAFSKMVSKATAQISPEAGPNLFWNTKYSSMIAEVGGGYGMLGRMLPEGTVGEMSLTEAEGRRIAQSAVNELGAGLELSDESSVFYGFYEFYVAQGGEVVGELDVNGYSGQVWYKDWGTPQTSVQNLISEQ